MVNDDPMTEKGEKSTLVDPQSLAGPTSPIAAIDIGTNSAHLVIAYLDDHRQLHVIDTEKITLRLGRDINTYGILSESAFERTIIALNRMLEICSTHTHFIRAVATHATRTAKNHKDFVDRIFKECGIKVEIVDGYEEARLEFLGIQQGLPISHETCLAVDIGGGSTEVIVGKGLDLKYLSSFKTGAVTLTKQYFETKAYNRKNLIELEKHVANSLAVLNSTRSRLQFEKAVASSGTAKAIANICAKLRGVDSLTDKNGFIFDAAELAYIYKRLTKTMDPKKIRSEFDLEQNRAEIIVAGTAILKTITDILEVKQWTTSTYSLREGLVIDTYVRLFGAETLDLTDMQWRSIVSFGKKFGLDHKFAEHVCKISLTIFDGLKPYLFTKETSENLRSQRNLLRAAAYLHEIGKSVNISRYHRHSEYIISNSSLTGFNQSEKQAIGLITRHHRKSIPNSSKVNTEELPITHATLTKLSACLRLATCLNRTRRNLVTDLSVKKNKQNALVLAIRGKGKTSLEAEYFKVEQEKHLLQKSLGFDIVLHSAS